MPDYSYYDYRQAQADPDITDFQKRQLREVVEQFPATFKQAQADWARFKAGYEQGLFDAGQINEITDWFGRFPKLWETVRPNFEPTGPDDPQGGEKNQFVYDVDEWVKRLAGESQAPQIGLAFIIVAGIILAGVLSAGGAIWAIGYAKKQHNISSMIDGVVEGKLSPEILEKAIKAESSPGLFGDLKSLLIVGVGTALFLTLYPQIIKLVRKD